MTILAVYSVIGVLAWMTVFGTIAGVMWRNRGGSATTGFVIGALFGIFGVAFCAFGTPSARARDPDFATEWRRAPQPSDAARGVQAAVLVLFLGVTGVAMWVAAILLGWFGSASLTVAAEFLIACACYVPFAVFAIVIMRPLADHAWGTYA